MYASVAVRSYATALALLLAPPLGPGRASAQSDYSFDQQLGEIAFSVSHLGLFTSQGEFRRFDATLRIDRAHPERTQIAVDVDAKSVSMSWQEAVTMLESPAYFDVTHYPKIRFKSNQVTKEGPDRYIVLGTLEIRGVTQPQSLEAVLVGRHFAPELHAEVADFVVTGMLKRSQFGMLSDQTFISDAVRIRIHVRLKLGGTAGEG